MMIKLSFGYMFCTLFLNFLNENLYIFFRVFGVGCKGLINIYRQIIYCYVDVFKGAVHVKGKITFIDFLYFSMDVFKAIVLLYIFVWKFS